MQYPETHAAGLATKQGEEWEVSALTWPRPLGGHTRGNSPAKARDEE